MSPALFNTYIDDIIRRWQKEIQQIESNKLSITLLFADDRVRLTDPKENLQRMIYKVHLIINSYMITSTEKTKVIAFHGKEQVRAKIER
jgi:hypothetical protein